MEQTAAATQSVVDPRGVVAGSNAVASTWHVDIAGATVGFLVNGKPNAENLLRAVERRLQHELGLESSVWANKMTEAEGPSQPATEAIYTRLSSGAIAVLAASGD